MLVQTLKDCKAVLSKLNLSSIKMDNKCINLIGEYIQDNEYLEELLISDNKISDQGIEMLSEYIIGNTTLKELNIARSRGITNASIPYLVGIVRNSCIIRINVEGTLIETQSIHKMRITLAIPISEREIPIKSNSKSAAKNSYGSYALS